MKLVVPILLIPFIIAHVGIEKFGIVALSQGLCTFFFAVTDYGFNITSVRQIALNKGNNGFISNYFGEVLYTKAFLATVSCVLFIIIISCISKFSVHYDIFIASLPIIVGQASNLNWYLQGVEKMSIISMISIVTNLLYAVAIFLFIKNPADYYWINPIMGGINVLINLIALLIICNHHKLSYIHLNPIHAILKQVKEGWTIFTANLSFILYANGSIVILGFFTDPVSVGYYSVAEKITFIIRTLLGTFNQAIYPQLCAIATQTKQIRIAFFRKWFLSLLIVLICISLLQFFMSPYICIYMVGVYEEKLIFILKSTAILPLIIAFNIPPTHTFWVYDHLADYTKIMFFATVLFFILSIISVPMIEVYGTIITLFITEIFTSLCFNKVVYSKYFEQTFL